LHALWMSLDAIPADEPGPAVKNHFYEMLSTAKAMQGSPEDRFAPVGARTERTFLMIPMRPAIQFAFAAVILFIGIAIGNFLPRKTDDPGIAQLTQLHEEVKTMSSLLTVSLLQQQSASDRLRGVSWSYRVDEPDPEVLSALLQTLKYDPNVNVRLASLDALSHISNKSGMKRELLSALPKQTSPLVQMAMVDLIIQWHEEQSVDLLRKMLADPKTNIDVKKRIQDGIEQLS